MAVVSAANALGVVGKYAADFGAAEAAYRRAMAAAEALAGADPLVRWRTRAATPPGESRWPSGAWRCAPGRWATATPTSRRT